MGTGDSGVASIYGYEVQPQLMSHRDAFVWGYTGCMWTAVTALRPSLVSLPWPGQCVGHSASDLVAIFHFSHFDFGGHRPCFSPSL